MLILSCIVWSDRYSKYACFYKNNFIFFNGLKNSFEPSYFKKPNLEDAKSLKAEILEILNSIGELKLNTTKIWG